MRTLYKAVSYERVSTTNEDQANSLINQRALMEKFLKRHPEFYLAEEPYSEIISGKSDNRPQYQAMIKRIEKGDIDYLIVKDLKRLCRSNEVSAHIRRLCQKYNFKLVLTSTSQIYDPNSEEYRLMFGFESLINEEVVHRQSMYGRIAHQQKIDAKRLNANDVRFGYKWDYEKKQMVVDEEETVILNEIYEMYVYQQKTASEISKIVGRKYALKGKYSKKLIASRTIRDWLKDSSYIGKFYINKKGTVLEVGVGAVSKRYCRPKDEWVLVERPDLKIIDERLFELAQRKRKEAIKLCKADNTGRKQNRFAGKHLFAGKVFCAVCGSPYHHYCSDRKRTIHAYRDSYSSRAKKVNLIECTNKDYSHVSEETLSQVTIAAINELIRNHSQYITCIRKGIIYVINHYKEDNSEVMIQERRIESLKAEADKIMESFIDAPQSMKAALAEKHEKLTEDMEALKSEMAKEEKTFDIERINNRLDEIDNNLKELSEIDILDRNTVKAFVRKIIVNEDGKLDVILQTSDVFKKCGQKKAQNDDETKVIKRSNCKGYSDCVFKMCGEGTMEVSAQDTQTVQKE